MLRALGVHFSLGPTMPQRRTSTHIFLWAGLHAASVSCAQSSQLPVEVREKYLQVALDVEKVGNISPSQRVDVERWTKLAPCVNVRQKLGQFREREIARAVSKTQGFPNSKVLGYFEFKGWRIVFTNASPGDEQYLVFDRDPVKGAKPVASWSGAATIFETSEIRDWLLAEAPRVPKPLADCWAWQVTLGQ